MFIKSMVLDGFKSYGNRIEINGFDREFNAITGLNGTGKSNILDAICFVLGITTLSNVRVNNLQELVYKSGQAGINKATVSITFDNRDKSQSPTGLESHDEITITRQVVIGGKNKYLLNGVTCTNKRAMDIFCSVQLNVNNPHFLIMQGRITKVLNMKPAEILSMVEEAAGTNMYETKKQETKKTIAKKDLKLGQLNQTISEEITPKLRKLKEERSQYQEYQKVVRELENLVRLSVAWIYVTTEDNMKSFDKNLEDTQNEIQHKKDKIAENKLNSEKYEKSIAEMNKKLDSESGNELQEIEKELQENEAIEAEISAKTREVQDNLKAQKSKQRLLQNGLNDDEKTYNTKKNQLDEMISSFGSLKSNMEKDAEALSDAQKRYQAASSGLGITEDGQASSLQDQIIAANQTASEASTQISQCKMEKEHMSKQLKDLQKEFSKSNTQFNSQQATIQKLEKEVANLNNELNGIGFDENKLENMEARRSDLISEVQQLNDNLDILGSQLRRCRFNYKDPRPNFDRRKVKGLVCRLIKVKDPIHCTALETCGGERLYNVIVDNQETGKDLIERGQLQNRTTMIPLNKIQGREINRETVRLAEQLVGANNVKTALSLVEYDPSFKPAMEWIFGECFICPDLDICRKVAFHPNIMKRCITLNGDVVDPRGTMSGGAPVKGDSVLLRLEELKNLEARLEPIQNELAKIDSEIKSLNKSYDAFMSCKQRFDRKMHELNALKNQIKLTTTHQTHTEIEELNAKLSEITSKLDELNKIHKDNVEKEKDLKEKMKDMKGHREKQLKLVEDELKKKKQQAEKSRNAWMKLEQNFDTLKLEVSELEKSVESGKEQLAAGEETLAELSEQLDQSNEELKAIKETVKNFQTTIKEKKAEIAAKSKEIKSIMQKKEQLINSIADIELEIKSLEHQVTKIKGDRTGSKDKLQALKNKYEWIASEREFFGEPGGLYDFKDRDPRSADQRISQLEQLKDKLGRNLNTRAQTLLGKEEEQHNEIMQRKTKVERDRKTLIATIEELDATKRKAVAKACEQVNIDFGSIFSALLPGAEAKLVAPEGMSPTEGLEVKVAFNGMWKEGLNELSGGQRSLVALSLILAMLLFQPAPLYILDEVDAALDLNHTQNIGNMLAKHFKKSQFIIVSLKDGMFNNANVLFRTKFVDGMSTVQRTVQKEK